MSEFRLASGIRMPVSCVIGLALATSARATVRSEALQNIADAERRAEAKRDGQLIQEMTW